MIFIEGSEIRKWRESIGLSAKMLARVCRVAPEKLEAYEKGVYSPSAAFQRQCMVQLQAVETLANIFPKVPIADFAGLDYMLGELHAGHMGSYHRLPEEETSTLADIKAAGEAAAG